MKSANILAGLMSHASQTPCTWCNAIKNQLHKCGQYRTLRNCLQNYYDWLDSGSKKACAKTFMNCTNAPVFDGDAGIFKLIKIKIAFPIFRSMASATGMEHIY